MSKLTQIKNCNKKNKIVIRDVSNYDKPIRYKSKHSRRIKKIKNLRVNFYKCPNFLVRF